MSRKESERNCRGLIMPWLIPSICIKGFEHRAHTKCERSGEREEVKLMSINLSSLISSRYEKLYNYLCKYIIIDRLRIYRSFFSSPFSSTPSTLLPLHTLGSLRAKCEMRWNGMRERKERNVREEKTFQIFLLLRLDSRFYRLLLLHFDVNEKKKKSFQLPQPYVLLSSSWLPPSLRHQIVCIFFTLSIWALLMLKIEDSFRFSTLAKESSAFWPGNTFQTPSDAAFSSSFNVNIYVDCGTFPIAPRIPKHVRDGKSILLQEDLDSISSSLLLWLCNIHTLSFFRLNAEDLCQCCDHFFCDVFASHRITAAVQHSKSPLLIFLFISSVVYFYSHVYTHSAYIRRTSLSGNGWRSSREEPFSLTHRWDESQPLRMITSALKFQNAQKIYLTSDAIVTQAASCPNSNVCCSCLRCQQKINNTKIVALCGDVNNNVSHVHLWLRLTSMCILRLSLSANMSWTWYLFSIFKGVEKHSLRDLLFYIYHFKFDSWTAET